MSDKKKNFNSEKPTAHQLFAETWLRMRSYANYLQFSLGMVDADDATGIVVFNSIKNPFWCLEYKSYCALLKR